MQNSKIYESLDVAKFYQQKYGGKISILSRYHEEIEVKPVGTGWLDGQGEYGETRTWKQDGNKYYILNVGDRACLKNGFRYIKELLLQYHNFKMFTDYSTLKENGIDVFSVKSDAMTIRKTDLDKAKSLIAFSADIGGWRFQNRRHQIPN